MSVFDVGAWSGAFVASPFDAHENACKEHKDGRKDHHHRVNGNGVLCGCHAFSINTLDKNGFWRRDNNGVLLVDFGSHFIASLDVTFAE